MNEKAQQKTCLVTGATGVVGAGLVRELLNNGYRVKVLARDPKAAAMFSQTVEIVPGELKDFNSLEKACADVRTVFHLAAKLHINNPNSALEREYWQTNVEATIKLVELAKIAGAEKFVFASTINVYGAGDGINIFDETSEINPQGVYAETKAAAEAAILNEDFAVVLRLAAVYGSRMKGNYVRLLEALKSKRFFFVGDALNRRTLIHQQDAARAFVAAAEKAAGKSIYNATDGELHQFQNIVAAMSQALDIKTPSWRIPLTPIKRAFNFVDFIKRTSHINFGVSGAMLDKLIEDAAVDGSKIQRELDFKPLFDLETGWREAVSKSAAQSNRSQDSIQIVGGIKKR